MDYLIQNIPANLHSLQGQHSYTSISREPMHTEDQIQSEHLKLCPI